MLNIRFTPNARMPLGKIRRRMRFEMEKQLPMPIDNSYEAFLERFGIPREDFFEFGLSTIRRIDVTKCRKAWDNLKRRIQTGGETVHIRGYGRNGKNSHLFQHIYKLIFPKCNIEVDKTNNQAPQKVIQHLTGLKRNVNIFNYQVSHIFGLTKNPYAFEAPWNIALIPKLYDPLTGHESKGKEQKEFTQRLRLTTWEVYEDFILDFNKICNDIRPDVESTMANILASPECPMPFKSDVLLAFHGIPKPETFLIDKEQEEAPGVACAGVTSPTTSIADLIRNSFTAPDCIERLDDESIRQLQDPAFCKKTFRVRHPVLQSIGRRTELTKDDGIVEGYPRYWKRIFALRGGNYLVTKEWFANQRDDFLRWGRAKGMPLVS